MSTITRSEAIDAFYSIRVPAPNGLTPAMITRFHMWVRDGALNEIKAFGDGPLNDAFYTLRQEAIGKLVGLLYTARDLGLVGKDLNPYMVANDAVDEALKAHGDTVRAYAKDW